MITEMLLLYAGYSTYNYFKNLDLYHFKYEFNEIMKGLGIKNKLEQTFKIKRIYKASYGYKSQIQIPNGLSLSKLESNIEILQDNLNGIITLDKDKFSPYIDFRIVLKDIDKFIYSPVKTKPNELYIGKLFTTKDYIIDLNKEPMLLIAGSTGTGKSMLLSIILTNLIYNSSKYIDIHLLQSMKSELSSFDECNCIASANYTLSNCSNKLKQLNSTLKKRSELFKQNGIRNIDQWNKYHKKEYMKRIIIVIEEISFFTEDETIWDLVASICKAGRSVGIHIISCVQRTTAQSLNTTVKSQMSKITFKQKSTIDSINVINTTDAVKLKERECIFDGNTEYVQVKTPYIDDDFTILHKYVPEIKIPTKSQVYKDNKNEVHNNNISIDEENNTVQYMETYNIIDIEEKDIKQLPKPNHKRNKGKIKESDFK